MVKQISKSGTDKNNYTLPTRFYFSVAVFALRGLRWVVLLSIVHLIDIHQIGSDGPMFNSVFKISQRKKMCITKTLFIYLFQLYLVSDKETLGMQASCEEMWNLLVLASHF